MEATIRDYGPGDEESWIRCRALSFLSSPYFDDVKVSKEHYEVP